MEARAQRATCVAWITVCLCFGIVNASFASGFRTTNFTVDAPTPELAKEIGLAAEKYRRELSIEWLGKEMPNWSQRCPIKAKVSPRLGAGGATSFVFNEGEVYDWRMEIQGSRERVLDSVLPHEVTHTIFASYFRQPLPRWADEGACTTMEHVSEVSKQERMLIEFLKTRRAIPFSDMMTMREYPSDVMPLYAQGHSLTHYLLQRRGKTAFLKFIADGLHDEDWTRASQEHYGYKDLRMMQEEWLNWIKKGRPKVALDADIATAIAQGTPSNDGKVRLASAEAPRQSMASNSNPLRKSANIEDGPTTVLTPVNIRSSAASSEEPTLAGNEPIRTESQSPNKTLLQWSQPRNHAEARTSSASSGEVIRR